MFIFSIFLQTRGCVLCIRVIEARNIDIYIFSDAHILQTQISNIIKFRKHQKVLLVLGPPPPTRKEAQKASILNICIEGPG